MTPAAAPTKGTTRARTTLTPPPKEAVATGHPAVQLASLVEQVPGLMSALVALVALVRVMTVVTVVTVMAVMAVMALEPVVLTVMRAALPPGIKEMSHF